MTERSEALRLADYLDNEHPFMDRFAAAELRRLHDENQRLRLIVPQVLEDLNDKLCEDNLRLTAQRDALLEAYRRMKNVAAAYSNFCDDSAFTRKLEREFEAVDALALGAIAKAEENT